MNLDSADEPVMTVYGAAWCPHCKRVKKFLAAHQVTAVQRDHDDLVTTLSSRAAADLTRGDRSHRS